MPWSRPRSLPLGYDNLPAAPSLISGGPNCAALGGLITFSALAAKLCNDVAAVALAVPYMANLRSWSLDTRANTELYVQHWHSPSVGMARCLRVQQNL